MTSLQVECSYKRAEEQEVEEVEEQEEEVEDIQRWSSA